MNNTKKTRALEALEALPDASIKYQILSSIFKTICDLFCCPFCRADFEFECKNEANTVKIHHRWAKHQGRREDDKDFPSGRKIILLANSAADNCELERNPKLDRT